MAHEMTSGRVQARGEGASGVALQDAGESLEVVISSAFAPVEGAFGNDLVRKRNDSVPESEEIDARLLNVVHPPKPIDFHALEEEASRHRLILMRSGAVISLAALVSIFGAFLYHAAIVGVLWAGTLMMPAQDRGGSRGVSLDTGGGIMTSDGPSSPSASPAPGPVPSPVAAAVAMPKAPPVVQPLPSPDQVAMNTLNNEEPAPDIIAIPGGETALGHLKTPLPQPSVVAPPEPIISPPNRSENVAPVTPAPVASVAKSATGAGAGGTGDDDEAPISLLRDGAGSGTDGRSGRGHGHLMGGDLPEPGPLETPDLQMKLTVPPKKDHMTYDVLVAPDGSVLQVKLTESSGEADLDELWRRQILTHWKFRAAHVNGKYIEASTSIIIRLTAQ